MIGRQPHAGEALGQKRREGLRRQLTRRTAETRVTPKEKTFSRTSKMLLFSQCNVCFTAVLTGRRSYLQPVREQCPLPEQKRKQDGPIYTETTTTISSSSLSLIMIYWLKITV